jgi:hypothetical protein
MTDDIKKLQEKVEMLSTINIRVLEIIVKQNESFFKLTASVKDLVSLLKELLDIDELEKDK